MVQKKKQKTKFEIAVMEIIRDLRYEKEYTQDEMAELMGVTRGFIGQVESLNSDSTYSLNHLNKLAYELKCPLADLLPKKPVVESDWKK
ncbi:MAG TPA: helix-turn-helix transcriptional regulator [Chitinophagaceae bacterium]|jgi:transcriptional regulator with XRE-family HTH domain|nr:helix-turn-helix transcriptional regulator [Chitinophagaceae bacterium]